MKGKALILPSVRKGDGLGHLSRCCMLAERLGEGAALWTGSDDEHVRDYLRARGVPLLPGDLPVEGSWDMVILDRRESEQTLVSRFLDHRIPVIGIDEGGEWRSRCSYLIDTFPYPDQSVPANISSAGFLDLPERKPMKTGSVSRVLISFGGEDPEKMSGTCAAALLSEGTFPASRITVVIGPLFEHQDIPEGVSVLHRPDNLKDVFREYDLVITSFGITAYEAAASGVPVLLLNPGEYHRRLAAMAGFPEIGILHPDLSRLSGYLGDLPSLRTKCEELLPGVRESLADRIEKLSHHSGTGCPVCGNAASPATGRFEEKTYFRCTSPSCNTVHMTRFSGKRRYTREYFFTEYKEQYGKTYLEDFDHILKMGLRRIERISGVMTRTGSDEKLSLLDIGCAYGPFLKAAKEGGLNPAGIDVSRDAVTYVQSTLDLPCACTSLEEFDPEKHFGRDTFDIITLWYVVEHLQGLHPMLRKIAGMLEPGGVLALSTPNGRGVSGQTDWIGFLRNSPDDHYTVWNPSWARNVLKQYGLKVCKTVSTGHHPERFPLGKQWKGGILRSVLLAASRICRLGDTFELYAVKE